MKIEWRYHESDCRMNAALAVNSWVRQTSKFTSRSTSLPVNTDINYAWQPKDQDHKDMWLRWVFCSPRTSWEILLKTRSLSKQMEFDTELSGYLYWWSSLCKVGWQWWNEQTEDSVILHYCQTHLLVSTQPPSSRWFDRLWWRSSQPLPRFLWNVPLWTPVMVLQSNEVI